MKKIEIIGNVVLLQELIDNIHLNLPNLHYTVIPSIKAKGNKGEANGDEVWPDTNFVFFSYIQNDAEKNALIEICNQIKGHSTENGLTAHIADIDYTRIV